MRLSIIEKRLHSGKNTQPRSPVLFPTDLSVVSICVYVFSVFIGACFGFLFVSFFLPFSLFVVRGSFFYSYLSVILVLIFSYSY